MPKLFKMAWASMLAVGLIAACGYVANIAKLIHAAPHDLTALAMPEIMRAVGVIFFPLGVVLGFF